MFGDEVLEPFSFVTGTAGGIGGREEGRVGSPVRHREVVVVALTYDDHFRLCRRQGVHVLRPVVGRDAVGNVDDKHARSGTVWQFACGGKLGPFDGTKFSEAGPGRVGVRLLDIQRTVHADGPAVTDVREVALVGRHNEDGETGVHSTHVSLSG